VRRKYVFADVDAAHRHMGKKAREARYLLVGLVSAVIYHHIDARDLRDDHWLKVCGDLATACKHFTLDRRKPVTASATSARGYGVGGYGKGGYGVGEESIQIQLNDGKSFQCLDLMENVLATCQNLMAPHTFSGQESQLAGVR